MVRISKTSKMNWLTNLGLNAESLRFREHTPEELAFYSKAPVILNICSRSVSEIGALPTARIDLKRIRAFRRILEYLDPQTNEKYLPYRVERPSVSNG